MPSPLPKEIGIGLIGFGNIGTGVVRWLQQNGDLINSRLPRPIRLVRIADIDLTRDRGVSVDPIMLTSDASELIRDPKVHIVIELMGGTGKAREIAEETLRAGKHLVTANKALLANFGADLMALAREKGVAIGYEASVGAGIPLIRAMHQSLAPNRFQSVAGVINGTTNFILTEMDATGRPFADVLGEAQRLGYAEPDPTFDIEGTDAAHKLAILASLAFGQDIRIGDVSCAGISRLRPEHFRWAERRGLRIKLLALARMRADGAVDTRVSPTLVRRNGEIGGVMGVFNAVIFQGEPIGRVFVYGRGAGQDSTSSGVLSDVMVIAAAMEAGGIAREAVLPWPRANKAPFDPSQSEGEFVLALETSPVPGSASGLPGMLEKAGLRLRSWECNAPEACEKAASAAGAANGSRQLWIETETVRRGDVDRALALLRDGGYLLNPPQIFYLEREI